MIQVPLGTLPPGRRSLGKRAFDLVAGSLLLGFSFPLLVLLVVVFCLCNRRNPFGSVETTGREGVPFQRFQLDAGSLPRRRWLSRLAGGRPVLAQRLLSLPALLHVLTGRMSLVGPRPRRVTKAGHLQHESTGYRERVGAAPGLVSPDILAPPDCSESARLEFEVLYLRKATLGLDLRILGWALREALAPAEETSTR